MVPLYKILQAFEAVLEQQKKEPKKHKKNASHVTWNVLIGIVPSVNRSILVALLWKSTGPRAFIGVVGTDGAAYSHSRARRVEIP